VWHHDHRHEQQRSGSPQLLTFLRRTLQTSDAQGSTKFDKKCEYHSSGGCDW
jgi:hypothetical protein